MIWIGIKTIIRFCLLGAAAYLMYTAPGPNSIQYTNGILFLILASTGD
jgi:hypothetical protein